MAIYNFPHHTKSNDYNFADLIKECNEDILYALLEANYFNV